jgi:subtilisin family serine protease
MRRQATTIAMSVLAAALAASLFAPTHATAGRRDPTVTTAYLTSALAELNSLVVPGEIVVDFRAGVGRAQTRAVHSATIAARASALPTSSGVHFVRLRAGVSVTAALRHYRSSTLVERAEPNLLRYLTETVPNDPSFDQQWGLDNTGQSHLLYPWGSTAPSKSRGTADADIDAPAAWNVQKGTEGVIVAVLDSGVDVRHPDLAANIWVNPGEKPGNHIDDDGNGYVDDVNGWDFAQEDASLLQNNESIIGFDHGTHVAGTIAAVMDNSAGIAGVCPQCKVMVLKIAAPTDTDGDGSVDTMAPDLASELEAIEYARTMGADVINASFGSPIFWSGMERRALQAAGEDGIVTVVAAGNYSADNDLLTALDFDSDGFADGFSPMYPASYGLPSIISVAASNHNDEYGYSTGCALTSGGPEWPCSFTSWGHDSVDVAAPGVDVLSTLPGGKYGTGDGTSFSAPHVAGVAGLIKSQNPAYTPVEIKNAIVNSVDTPDTLTRLQTFSDRTPTGTFTASSGRVNALAALSASPTPNSPVTDGTPVTAGSIDRSAKGSVAWPHDVNDFYKKKLVDGGRYEVSLRGTGGDANLVVWKPKIMDPWQVEWGCLPGTRGACKILRDASQPGTSKETAVFTATSSGVHYFHVSATLFAKGDYTLTVTRL